MNRSNATSFSFTVEDDLISQTSQNTTFVQPKSFAKKPFSMDYGPSGADGRNHYDQRPVPAIQKKIQEQAHNDAYKQLNNDLFNPFQHRLNNGFVHKQSDLYERQKQKQIQMIKKKEEEQMNSNKNYTILFNQNQPRSRSLQVAANSILNEETVPSIGDYYNQKFKKKEKLQEISQEQENEVKNNNFIADKKVVRSAKRREEKPRKQVSKQKLVKYADGWKRESQSQKQISTNERVSTQNKQPNREQDQTYTPTIPKPSTKREPPKPRQLAKVPSKPQSQPQTQFKPQPKINSKNTKNTQHKAGKPKGQLLPNGKKKYSEVYEGPDKNLVELLERQISECPNITFDDIAQLQTAKGLLQEAVLLPRMMPQFFKGIRKAMKGILLFGPPGTGKTLLAKAIATNNMFFNVSASSLASKWKGQSQKMVRLLFEMARYHSPSVIFFDEIDCIATKRSENQHQSTRKVKTQLLVQMDGVGNQDQGVFVLAATNRPWDLDEALRRRLQKRIYIALPGKEGRRKLFDINLKELTVSKKIDWDKLVDATKGCSGADICNICRDAAYMPMRRKLSQVGGIAKISQLSQTQLLNEEVGQADLMQAARKSRPSVGTQDLKRYSQWMKQFGSS